MPDFELDIDELEIALDPLLFQGPKGDPGEPGKDGRDGVDGKDGRDGQPGPKGDSGLDGLDGAFGVDGIDGKDGRDGVDGLNGKDGKDGKDGERGPQGLAGTDGKDGRDGIDGKDGKQGRQGIKGDPGGGGGHRITVYKDGVAYPHHKQLQFTGDGVTISDSVSATIVDIPGGTGPGGSSDWGDIGGTLSDQVDLQAALDAKADDLGVDDNYVTDAEKVKLSNLSGTNSGDQTSIVGITGTKAEFDAACTDGNFVYGPAGSDTQVLFNDGGAFAGDAGLTYDKTADTLTINTIPFGKGAGTASVLVGISNTASATSSVSIGRNITNSSVSGVAFGNFAIAGPGPGALAIGSNAEATKTDSVAIGNNATSRVDHSLAIGTNALLTSTDANDDGQIAIGPDSEVRDCSNSIAIGVFSTVIGFDGSIALGVNAAADATRQLMIGSKVSSGSRITQIKIGASSTAFAILQFSGVITSDKTFTFPNTTGTVALTSDITAVISDTAYDATTWNGVTTIAPTKNAVRDQFEAEVTANRTLTTKTIALGSNTVSGTKAQFDTACTDGNFLYVGDVTSGLTRSIVSTVGSVTMLAAAATDYVYIVTGAHTITCPTAVGNTNRYTIKNNHSAAITVNTTSSQTMDGATTLSLGVSESIDLISNNANWSIL